MAGSQELLRNGRNGEVELHLNGKTSKKGSNFVKKMALYFDCMKRGFPHQEYGGSMDLLCSLSSGETVLVEMQVIPQNFWDRRTLAYASNVYSRQLRKGASWEN